jgi:hypothetical protein
MCVYMTHAQLVTLASLYAAHRDVSIYTLGVYITGNSHFFERLREGKTCTIKSAWLVLHWFSDRWPDDLEWPEGLVRPAPEAIPA